MRTAFLLITIMVFASALIVSGWDSTKPLNSNQKIAATGPSTPDNFVIVPGINQDNQNYGKLEGNVDPAKIIKDIPSLNSGGYPCSKFKDVFETAASKPVFKGKSLNDFGLNGEVLGALAKVESGCGHSRKSNSGDYGILQINQIHLGSGGSCPMDFQTAMYDDEKNAECSAKILAGNLNTALKRGLNGYDAIIVAFYGYNSGFVDQTALYVSKGFSVQEAFKRACTNNYCYQSHRLNYPANVLKNLPREGLNGLVAYADNLRRSNTNYA